MSIASLISAYIQFLPPGVGTVEFPYNPDEITIHKQAQWNHTPQPAQESGPPQFHGAQPSSLDITILLDTFAIPPSPPEEGVKILQQGLEPSEESKAMGDPKPPTVTFGWGNNIVMAEAYITSMTITYNRFLLGVPVRAEVKLTLEEVPVSLPGTNPTSGGLATRRTRRVVAGDTLASIAFQEYGDPNRWRALAVANDIDDPMRIKPGRELLVPEAGEAAALA